MRKRQYKQPGAPPGTLTAPADALAPKAIHVIYYTADKFEEMDVARVQDIQPYKEATGITWINVDGLGDTEVIRGLGELFGLHPLALEDVLSVHQRPKVDDYDTHLFLVVRMLHYEQALSTEQISMFLGKDYVITFQEQPGDCLEPIRDRLRKGTGQLRRQGPDFLLYAIVDAIVDHHFPFLERVGEVVEELEDAVVAEPTRRTIGRIHDIKRELLDVRRSVWPLREAVNSLIRDESPLVKKNTRLYIRDCYDHAVQVLDIVETYRELAAGLMDVYLSSLSNKMNEVMKVLTVIATIFIPLTFIVGVYGMNFSHEASPYNMPELTWRYGYVTLWGIMLALAAVMLILFRRKGWIGGDRRR